MKTYRQGNHESDFQALLHQAPGATAATFRAPSMTSAQNGLASGELALLSATDLAQLIQQKQVSSFELTRHYIERIEQFGKVLNAVW